MTGETTVLRSLACRLAALLALALAGCASAPADTPPPADTASTPPASAPVAPVAQPAPSAAAAPMVVEEFGVQVRGVRLSANGYLVDLRYRVLDPARARAMLDRKVRPVLVDETSGSRFYVPAPPIVGALRQTARNKVIHTDRDYFMLFANPDRKLKAGSKVALYVGEQRFGDLQIETQPVAP